MAFHFVWLASLEKISQFMNSSAVTLSNCVKIIKLTIVSKSFIYSLPSCLKEMWFGMVGMELNLTKPRVLLKKLEKSVNYLKHYKKILSIFFRESRTMAKWAQKY